MNISKKILSLRLSASLNTQTLKNNKSTSVKTHQSSWKTGLFSLLSNSIIFNRYDFFLAIEKNKQYYFLRINPFKRIYLNKYKVPNQMFY